MFIHFNFDDLATATHGRTTGQNVAVIKIDDFQTQQLLNIIMTQDYVQRLLRSTSTKQNDLFLLVKFNRKQLSK